MNQKLFITGCALMALAVVLGAMGAHALESRISSELLTGYESAVRYQVYHALALIVLSTSGLQQLVKHSLKAITAMLLGVLFFSGSIYALTFGALGGFEWAKYIWWVTPLGGTLLIISWVLLIISALRK
jgi:uncharacterized membrane protein YgdD (TMEM256/DUF423 family)